MAEVIKIYEEKNLFKKYSKDNILKRERKNKICKYIFASCAVIGILMLVILIATVWFDGKEYLSFDFIKNAASRNSNKAGIFPAIVGSLVVIVLTIIFAIPVGIGSALYIEEYMKNGKLKDFIELNIVNLAGIPAIVYGIFGLAFFVQILNLGRGILSAALTMGLLIMPTIIITTKETLKQVPISLKEGSYALGVSKWDTVTGVILPFAMPGILTGIILSISRGIGESSPLIMVGAASYVTFLPDSLFSAYTTLPLQIYNWTARPQVEFQSLAAAGIIVLLIILLGLNATAIILRNKYKKKAGF